MGFIFGGDTGQSLESLKRRRALANSMMARSTAGTPRNVGEGLTALGNAIAGKVLDKRVGRKEDIAREEATAVFNSLFGGQPAQQSPLMAAQQSPMQTASNDQIAQTALDDPAAMAEFNQRFEANQNGGLDGAIANSSQQHGVDAGYLKRLAEIESGYGTNLVNPNSSARGPFQFISSTAKQYGLADPMDFNQSADAAARFTNDNKNALVNALGREPTPGELYLAHQQGAGGAIKLLSNPNARAVDIVGADAVRLNGGNANMSAMDFAQLWAGKFGGAQSPQGGQSMQAPQAMGVDPRLMQAMSNPYMSDSQKAVMQAMLGQQMQSADPMRQLQMQKAQLELQQMQNPQPGYRQVSGQELGMSGDLADAMFNVGPDGKVSRIGGGGVTVNNQAAAPKPAAGYRNVFDDTGNLVSQEVIPGGPAEQAQQSEQAEAQAVHADDMRGAQNTLAVLDQAMAHPGMEGALGDIQGGLQTDSLVGRLGLSDDATDFVTIHDQLKGKVFLEAYEGLKGGGPITDIEGRQASAAVARLNRALTPEDYRAALQELKDLMQTRIGEVSSKTPSSPPENGTTLKFNPETGEFE